MMKHRSIIWLVSYCVMTAVGAALVFAVIVAGGSVALASHHSASADELQEGQRQQCHREGDQDDAQDDGTRRAPDDALLALLGRQLAAGQRDHDRVVAAQQDVDDDDLAQGHPERGVSQKVQVHKVLAVE